MTVNVTQDINTRIKLIREKVNRLQMLDGNNCKELFTKADILELKELLTETRHRIRTQKLNTPIKAFLKG